MNRTFSVNTHSNYKKQELYVKNIFLNLNFPRFLTHFAIKNKKSQFSVFTFRHFISEFLKLRHVKNHNGANFESQFEKARETLPGLEILTAQKEDKEDEKQEKRY